MIGICSYGSYVPRYRLKRELIYKETGWINPANVALSRGEKSVANYDEDCITMAVAAARKCLWEITTPEIDGLFMASTTMPYKERLNTGIVAAALGLSEKTRTADFSGSVRAGTTALISALESVLAGSANTIIVTAADGRLGKPGSAQEMIYGDAAGALAIGKENVIAEYKGSFSLTHDFVDRFRSDTMATDRQWEDRWVQDMGFMHIIPEAIKGLFEKYHLKITDFAKVIYPCHYVNARRQLNKKLGITEAVEQSNFMPSIGETGSPQPFLMLMDALENAKAGDKILLVGFGNGCDALFFQVTENINKIRAEAGVRASLENRAELDNYIKYLVWRNALAADFGLRAEEDVYTPWSMVWRKRKEIFGLYGSKCEKCGTVQYPPQRICVNPDCEAIDQMADYRLADKTGRILSYTGDVLAATASPPAIYAQIEFEGGGKNIFDLTDCDLKSIMVGSSIKMSFRIKYHDRARNIVGYFWKAIPTKEMING